MVDLAQMTVDQLLWATGIVIVMILAILVVIAKDAPRRVIKKRKKDWIIYRNTLLGVLTRCFDDHIEREGKNNPNYAGTNEINRFYATVGRIVKDLDTEYIYVHNGTEELKKHLQQQMDNSLYWLVRDIRKEEENDTSN